MKLRDWVRLPSAWIQTGGLKAFRWTHGGSANTAALMLLLVIAHHANDEDGVARLPYGQLKQLTNMSRTKIADGLDLLAAMGLIIREPEGRSTYQLAMYDRERHWAMLPARALYTSGQIRGFKDFHLRKPTELDALKAYLAFAAWRNNDSNLAFLTHEKLVEHTGIPAGRVATALSILAIPGLVIVEQHQSSRDASRIANAYRLTHLQPRRHRGTAGREELTLSGAPLQPLRDPLDL